MKAVKWPTIPGQRRRWKLEKLRARFVDGFICVGRSVTERWETQSFSQSAMSLAWYGITRFHGLVERRHATTTLQKPQVETAVKRSIFDKKNCLN